MSASVSIVVSTNARGDSVAGTMSALEQIDHSPFEVIVVIGPDDQGTTEALAPWQGRVKVLRCAARNLSEARNLGIAAAAGELIAFIDDDAVPDPGWLAPIVEAFDDPGVAAAGGPVLDHTGGRLQALFSSGTRTGLVRAVSEGPVLGHLLSAPDSWGFPITLGTNSCFRRDRLVELGGFDEVFDYYHDEADVCLRLVDSGFDVRPLSRGLVYHKFLPSEIRGEERVVVSWARIMKNLAYFAFRHGLPASSFARVSGDLAEYAASSRSELERQIADGRAGAHLRAVLERDIEDGFEAGKGLAEGEPRRTRPVEWFAERQRPFLPFVTRRHGADKLHVCLLSQEYLPGTLNGVGRVVHELAVALADIGHVVRVLTRGEQHLRVDLEEGVWVHRVPPSKEPPPDGLDVPSHIWAHAAAMDEEVQRVARIRPVDVVQFANWDAEGIAILERGSTPTSVWPVTSVRALAGTDPRVDGDAETLAALARLERRAFLESDRVMASSPAVIADVERDYGIRIAGERIDIVPLGIPDAPPALQLDHPEQMIEILFVGRLEPRKGVDVLLAAAPGLLMRHPDVRVTIAGDDSQPGPDGRTYRHAFESGVGRDLRHRVRFLGQVDDAFRDALYASCDIFAAPSRYESFGVVLLEAMRCAKPVVASAVGGMEHIVEDDTTGLLVSPGDPSSLATALERLIESEDLRASLGAAGRARFLERYTADAMASGANRHFDAVSGRHTADASIRPRATPPVPDRALTGGLDLAAVTRCPGCRGPIAIVARVETAGGRIKEADLICPDCDCLAGRILDAKWDFHGYGRAIPDRPAYARVVPDTGERRLDPGIPPYTLSGDWRRGAGLWRWSDGRADAVAHVRAAFTDAAVRMLRHPDGGSAAIALDGQHVSTVDLRGENRAAIPVVVARDLPFDEHTITIRGTDHAAGRDDAQIHLHQVILNGPVGAGFPQPFPLQLEANDYSPLIEEWIARTPADELILECGGGDRRRAEPNHLNFEFQRYELADVYGDTHHLPFADDSFGLVFSQALFQHLENPFRAAEELVRVTKPGGHIVTEVAFMQPLHGAPFHFFNMTLGGVEALFAGCDTVASGWFGPLSSTVEWMLQTAGLDERAPSGVTRRILDDLRTLDSFVNYEDLGGIASSVYLVVRTPE